MGVREGENSLCVLQLQTKITLNKQLSPKTGPTNFPLLYKKIQYPAATLCMCNRPHIEGHHSLVCLSSIHWEHLKHMTIKLNSTHRYYCT